MKGTLYIVATPIGNLEDITLRALKVLKEVDLIAAEDTRHTLQLLNHYEISKPLVSYYKQKEAEKTDLLLNKLENGENIALVSDAGTPGISDPGEVIIKSAINRGIKVIPIPGACAAINALIASGMQTSEFCFIGFLPTNLNEKKNKISELMDETKTIIIYEAPHRLIKTLKVLNDILGNRNIVLCKELTKIHESYERGSLEEVIEKIQEPKGEYVIILEGASKSKKEFDIEKRNNMTLDEHYEFYKNQGLEKKEIIKQIAKERGVSKNEIYQYFIKE